MFCKQQDALATWAGGEPTRDLAYSSPDPEALAGSKPLGRLRIVRALLTQRESLLSAWGEDRIFAGTPTYPA
ncbi:Tyrosine-Protein Kinase Syk [Manis pentadactyla]|nr:Tyrosine-Protein Kinase Syk [Manis pentadactyla]